MSSALLLILLFVQIFGASRVHADVKQDGELSAVQPAVYTEKMGSFPDLRQSDLKADFPEKWEQYCTPVAVSNSLMWLASHGFSNLVSDSGGQRTDPIRLAKLLSSAPYMDTAGAERGTRVDKQVFGLKKYLNERGYSTAQLWIKGFDKSKSGYGQDEPGPEIILDDSKPDLNWLKRGIVGDGVAWVSIVRYYLDPSIPALRPDKTHIMALVGYGVNHLGEEDPDVLIFRDPFPQFGKQQHNTFLRFEKVDPENALWKSSIVRAPEHYKVAGKVVVDGATRFFLLRDALVLEMNPE